jgi:hypothetical protein
MYEYVVGLRAVTFTDGMTADFYPFDMKFLGETATRIINEVKGVNRVVYDVTSKRRARSSEGSLEPTNEKSMLRITGKGETLSIAYISNARPAMYPR